MAEKHKRKPEKILIQEVRSPGYKRWIENGANIIKKELPWEGPADVSITIGSGLSPIIDQLQLHDVRHISYEDIGLPIGQNKAHKKELIAGITAEGKKVLIFNGRTHAYEIDEKGLKTKKWGHLDRMELATGYLAMLNEIGAENVILTCAAGGINHPMEDFQEKPFNEETLPVISLIGADLNQAYPSPHMGHYKAKKGDFFGLKDADAQLMNLLKTSIQETEEITETPTVYYVTSPSTPNFEDVAVIHNVAINGGQVVGMSYSYEKEFLSGLNNIGRFMGIAVVTNSVELVFINPPPYRIKESISIEELRHHYPWEFTIAHPATDEEVQRVGKLAQVRLGKGLNQMIKFL